ncbi:MAG: DUF4349 domain-containing protein [Lachnospiraceae bacterium]|nr:DUF4349 domain-containing protein [Lachnospiraceae bacterium]
MKKMKIAIVLLSCMLLTGCGSASYDAAMPASGSGGNYFVSENSKAAAPAAVAEENAEYEYDDSGSTAPRESGTDNPLQGRKLITTLRLTAETENLDESLASVEAKVKELGGYVQSSDTYYDSYYDSYRSTQSTYLVLRIPAEKLDVFMETVESATSITNKSTSVEDVTLQYVDLESHKSALLTEESRLTELMEKAETVEDLITIEDKLADVRYQLESMESQLRTYDNQIDYSTIYLDIREVTRTTAKPETTIERMTSGFSDSLYGVGIGIRDFFVGIVIYLPYIVLWAVIICVVILIIRKIRKGRKNREPKKLFKRKKAKEDNKENQEKE